MREQAIFNLEIKKKSGLSINPDIHHSKVFSSEFVTIPQTNIEKLQGHKAAPVDFHEFNLFLLLD